MEMSTNSEEATSIGDPDPDLSDFHITGHNIIVRPLLVESKTKGGILLTDSLTKDVNYLMNVCKVLKLGPRAYVQDMFEETGPWCKEGDYVLIPKIGGQKMKYKGVPVTIISCDRVIAVLEDPSTIDPNYNIGV